MSDSNEPQLHENFNSVGPDVESVPRDDLESTYQKLLRAHSVNEEEIDNYVDKMHCSYSEALLHFGFSMSEFNDNSGDSISESIPETENGNVPIADRAAVDIGTRAVHLSGALDEYLKYTKLNGFYHARDAGYMRVLRQTYDSIGTEKLINSQQAHLEKGDREFHKASGAQSMIKADYNPSEVLSIERKLENEFIDRFTSPQNEEARKKLRRTLKRQMK